MAQQTAVDWLEKEIKNEDHHTEGELGNACIDVNTLLMLLEQAKQMEKEQNNHTEEHLEMVSSQTEISDEEIEKAAKECVYEDLGISVGSFELGARWYREQFKKK